MDENKLTGQNEINSAAPNPTPSQTEAPPPAQREKQNATPPTVEYLPDLNNAETEETAEPETAKSVKIEPQPPKKEPVKIQVVKRKGISVPAFITALVLCIVATFMATYVLLFNSYKKQFSDFASQMLQQNGNLSEAIEKLKAVNSVVEGEYLYDIDSEKLSDGILAGYVYGLGDKYAEYFNKEQMSAFTDENNAKMQGIGVSVTYNADKGFIQIINVFPDSPAFEAGLAAGDEIGYVKDGEDYVSVASLGYTKALAKLRGEAGTVAEFAAYRNGDYENPTEYSIKREFVTEYTVTSEIYEADSTVGIIKISSFDNKTPEQFKKALSELKEKGVQKLVFDVRNNPGGDKDSVGSILDMLVPAGPVIRTIDKNGNEEVAYSSDANEIDMPMAVVANGNTASAGELFCAALRDYKKAKIVGETTYGKGSMQSVRTFTDGTGFKFTYRYYCPPFSDNYDGVGVIPDEEVKLSESAAGKNLYLLSQSEDAQLIAAVNTMK